MLTRVIGISSIALVAASGAMAATNASAVTELNLRAAPNATAEIIDVIPGEGQVVVESCVGAGEWCQVTFEGQTGYAYSPYLTAPLDGQPAVVFDNREALSIETVTVEDEEAKESGALGGAATGGIIAGSLIGGPAAVAAGLAAGAVAGGELADDEKTVTYIRQNPVDPVYLDGEVVVGAGIPQNVTLQQLPDSDYSYVYVNGLPVVVDGERRIVGIIR